MARPMKTSREIHRDLSGQLEGDCLTGALALVNYSTAACIWGVAIPWHWTQ